MREKELVRLLEKAEELKVVDFLEEVINFVRNIKPILNTMSASIADNVVKIPSASRKLAQVTEATENATNEIMNILDSVFANLAIINSNLDKMTSGENNLIDDTKKISDEISNDANSIMMALQIQDITSQQIAAVNNVMDKILRKLSLILEGFEISNLKTLIDEYREEKGISSSVLHREIAFDPNAIDSISMKDNRQNDVDDLIKQIESGEAVPMSEENVANSDIDELMSSLTAFDDEDENAGAFSENELSDNMEEISQDDIDALFKNL